MTNPTAIPETPVISASCDFYSRGDHAIRVQLGPLTVWFSYQTPVAFQLAGGPLTVCRNNWSNTTGRHIAAIDHGDKDNRLGLADFERAWAEQVEPLLGAAAAQ